jgi:hypothetical protein
MCGPRRRKVKTYQRIDRVLKDSLKYVFAICHPRGNKKRLNPKSRIYIHSPINSHLSPQRLMTKEKILNAVKSEGFDPQEFGEGDLWEGLAWSFDNAARVMERCQGAVILALPKYIRRTKYRVPCSLPMKPCA